MMPPPTMMARIPQPRPPPGPKRPVVVSCARGRAGIAGTSAAASPAASQLPQHGGAAVSSVKPDAATAVLMSKPRLRPDARPRASRAEAGPALSSATRGHDLALRRITLRRGAALLLLGRDLVLERRDFLAHAPRPKTLGNTAQPEREAADQAAQHQTQQEHAIGGQLNQGSAVARS